MKKKVREGDVWFADLPMVEGRPDVQQGRRPVIIACNEKCLNESDAITVVVGTTQIDEPFLPTQILLGPEYKLREDTVFMAEQITTISRSELMFYITTLPEPKMQDVKKCIAIQTGLFKTFDGSYVKKLLDEINELDHYKTKYGIEHMELRNTKLVELKAYCREYNYNPNVFLEKYKLAKEC